MNGSAPFTASSPLSAAESADLKVVARLFGWWARSRRRRRLLFLALASPGFIAVFATPLHQNLVLFLAGLLLFAAACAFRARTERLFVHAEATARRPPAPSPQRLETPHV